MRTSEPYISVGILRDKKIEFELYGDFTSYGMKNTFSGQFIAELNNNIISCRHGNDKIDVSGEITFEPQDMGIESFLVRNVIVGKKFHWQKKENHRFTGSLKLIKEGDKITLINILPLENYLTSVISSEMNPKNPVELLKAHSIISRSWILAQMQKAKTTKKRSYDEFNSETEHIKWYDKEDHIHYDVCNDDHCQRYYGITKVFSGVANETIEQTRGIVMMDNNRICDARYSKSCGGISEAYENVWEPVMHKYLRPVVDYKYEPDNYSLDFSDEKNAEKWIKGNPPSFCNTNERAVLSRILVDTDQLTPDFYRWRVEYSQDEISGIIAAKSGIDFGNIIDLVPVERGPSARLVKLKIIGTKKTLIVGKELEIRKFLSPSHLYSSAFIVEKVRRGEELPMRFILLGAGWGHGVGLCQIGAAVMASRGYLFDEILMHYFTGVKLRKIY